MITDGILLSIDMKVLNSYHFATLYNGKTIFYSHHHDRDIKYVSDKIKELDHEVILITGASDHCADSFFVPDNVKYWFAQNALSDDPRIIPIPIGLCNFSEYEIPNQHPIGCGGSYEYCDVLSKNLIDVYLNDNTSPQKFIYSNFSVYSNPQYRSMIRQMSVESSFITSMDPDELGFISSVGKYTNNEDGVKNYISKILDHEAVLCPIGNGVDTHRLWESLYCKRIPITIDGSGKSPNAPSLESEYSIYKKLYSKLPIVILNDVNELRDENHLRKLVNVQKQKKFDEKLLDFNYWRELILNSEKNLRLN